MVIGDRSAMKKRLHSSKVLLTAGDGTRVRRTRFDKKIRV